MTDTYVAFDVETPNSRNDRISAIGVVVVEDGQQTTNFYTLVDPETHFDAFNIQLTGITPRMVRGKPSFPVLWALLQPLMEKGILCAHNATFDLGVLAKCLHAYGIPWQTRVKYACTVRMSRQMHPETENHRLNTMCDCLGIELDHHHAGSDSHACGEILRRYLDEVIEIDRFIRTYDLQSGRTLR